MSWKAKQACSGWRALLAVLVLASAGSTAGPAPDQATGTRPAAAPGDFYSARLSEQVQVTLPKGYRLPSARMLRFTGDGFELLVWCRSFAQGEAGYVEFRNTAGNSATPLSLELAGRVVPLARRSWGYQGIFALAPWDRAGWHRIDLRVRRGRKPERASFRFQIAPTRFRTYYRSMDLGRYSNRGYLAKRPELVAFIRENRRKKARVFARRSDLMFDGSLRHPRDRHFVTSPFHAKRVTQRYSRRAGRRVAHRARVSHHSGTDLKGRVGEPIFALARGRARIAQEMYYEGGFVVLDHGHGVFTTYMHQSKVQVREGALVAAGETIGAVGSTGMVTGPHLHVTLLVRGIRLDPLSLLVLPLRS